MRSMLLCLFVMACSKTSAPIADAGSFVDSSFDSDSSSASIPDAKSDSDEGIPAPAGEASRWSSITSSDSALASLGGLLSTHFDKMPPKLDLQSAPIAHDRTALLVSASKATDASSPMPLLAVTDHGKTLWSKDMTLGGISPPVLFPTITANARASVTLVAFDPPTHIVMARVWDEDGAPFADFSLLEGVPCDALSAAYWPGHGIVVVTSSAAGARMQVLRDDGKNAFSTRGEIVGGAWRATSPVSIVIDSFDTLMLAMHGAHGKSDAVAIYRYDDQARMKWAGPVMIDVATVTDTQARIVASLVSPGVASVETLGATFGKAVRVESSGTFVRVTK